MSRRRARLAQYLRVKAQHRDAILLFRLGDFYEMFFEDARTGAAVLDLTLTARNRGDPDEVPLCGFPAHAAQPYVTRLLAAGHAVAICEQGEPGPGKKLIEREVVRVITPGTILEEESLEPGAPSLLVALVHERGRTVRHRGDRLRQRRVPGQRGRRLGRRTRGAGAPGAARAAPAGRRPARARDRAWAVAAVGAGGVAGPGRRPGHAPAAGGAGRGRRARLRRHGVPAAAGAPAAARGVCALRPPRPRRGDAAEPGAAADARRRAPRVAPLGARRDRDADGRPAPAGLAASLRCSTRSTSGERLDAVEALVEDVAARAALREALAGMGDLERLAGRVGARVAGPRDLATLAAALARVDAARRAVGGLPGALLDRLVRVLDPLPDVSGEITATLVEAPPPHTRIPGFIRPGCHPEVDALRESARDGKGWLARFEAEERRRTGITSLKVRYNKVFGYYVEVTKPNLPAGAARLRAQADAGGRRALRHAGAEGARGARARRGGAPADPRAAPLRGAPRHGRRAPPVARADGGRARRRSTRWRRWPRWRTAAAGSVPGSRASRRSASAAAGTPSSKPSVPSPSSRTTPTSTPMARSCSSSPGRTWAGSRPISARWR